MSHTVRTKGSCKNPIAMELACKRIEGAEFLGVGSYRQYSGSQTGIGIKLPGYNYPIVVKEESGDIMSDTYGGRWGDPKLVDQFKQGCAVEAGKLAATEQGHSFNEQLLPNGDIKCTVTIGGEYGVSDGEGEGSGGYGVAPSGGES